MAESIQERPNKRAKVCVDLESRKHSDVSLILGMSKDQSNVLVKSVRENLEENEKMTEADIKGPRWRTHEFEHVSISRFKKYLKNSRKFKKFARSRSLGSRCRAVRVYCDHPIIWTFVEKLLQEFQT